MEGVKGQSQEEGVCVGVSRGVRGGPEGAIMVV